jgi:hypothetical protein
MTKDFLSVLGWCAVVVFLKTTDVMRGGNISDHAADISKVIIRIMQVFNRFLAAYFVMIFKRCISGNLLKDSKKITFIYIQAVSYFLQGKFFEILLFDQFFCGEHDLVFCPGPTEVVRTAVFTGNVPLGISIFQRIEYLHILRLRVF